MKKKGSIKNFFAKLGPGLITGASDDDPSGIATYSQAGAQFGLGLLWTAFLTFPLMLAVQEMCARIGLASSQGLISNIKRHYSPFIIYTILLLMVPTIVFNISADIASMGAVIHLLVPAIPIFIASLVMCIFMLFYIIVLSYRQMVSFLKYLCLSLLLYLIIPFLCKQDLPAILKSSFTPGFIFTYEYVGMFIAILGTTISPYLFFWQTTMAVEDAKHKKTKLTGKHFTKMVQDVAVGMFSSNLVMYFIILTTGTVLYKNGIHQILTVEDAAKALEPLAGEFAFLLFSLGILGTGFLAIPVLAGCLSYMVCSTFDCSEGLDKKLKHAKLFYFLIGLSILLALLLNLIGLNPIKALIISAIANGLASPPLLLIILWMANDKKIMGKKTNGILSNSLGVLTWILMTGASILFFYFQLVK
ncbi:NRAMP family divalent metal transporter [Legionella dresdenensis]|uniref:NRAMP family divalent metal transporter n=1 Tax=Legionella dresdenensis TaxID=450200 RepID=A0ABV8CFL9_9GAMM